MGFVCIICNAFPLLNILGNVWMVEIGTDRRMVCIIFAGMGTIHTHTHRHELARTHTHILLELV